MATHSSILAWKISWIEEPGGLQSMVLQIVRHDWASNTYLLKLLYPHCKLCLNLSMNGHKEIRGEKKHISKTKTKQNKTPQISAIVTTYHSRPSLENRKEMGEGPLLKLLVKETTVKTTEIFVVFPLMVSSPERKLQMFPQQNTPNIVESCSYCGFGARKPKFTTVKITTVPSPTSQLPP